MILVTGSSGFLGRAIVESLPGKSIGLSRSSSIEQEKNNILFDLTRHEHIDKLIPQLQAYNIDKIVHAAGVTPWSSDPNFSRDIQMAESVAIICDRLNILELYYLSGWNVYDMSSNPPYHENTNLKFGNDYGKSKLAVEKYFKRSLQNTEFVNLRLSSIYGVGQTSTGLIPNFTKRALDGETLEYQSLETRRDYLYIDDFVNTLEKLLRMNSKSMDLNIGSGISVSVPKIAQTIQSICATKGYIVKIKPAEEQKEAEPIDNRLDIQKAQSIGLLTKTTSLNQGLKEYITWVET
jgi:nucleoside-diphosphate-sugar epimerase